MHRTQGLQQRVVAGGHALVGLDDRLQLAGQGGDTRVDLAGPSFESKMKIMSSSDAKVMMMMRKEDNCIDVLGLECSESRALDGL